MEISPMRTPTRSLLAAAALSMLVPLCWPAAGWAARYVKFAVYLDKRMVLTASTGDEGQDADTVWGYLKTLPLKPVDGFVIKPDPRNPLRATLRGTALIFAPYGGAAEVRSLGLVRKSADSTEWTVEPRIVESSAKYRMLPR
jgi:hypothetical protein